MNFTQIKCFWAVAATGSFSEAAEQLYMSQPAISKNVMALEKELGIKLITRNGKHIAISEEGNKMLRYYTELLNTYDKSMAAAEKLRLAGDRREQSIHMIGIPVMARYGAVISLMEFMKDNPETTVNIEECEEDKVRYSLEAGACDLVFCTDINLNERVFSWQPWYRDRFVALVPIESELARYDTISVKQLEGHRFILSPRESKLYDACIDTLLANGIEPEVVLTTSLPPTAIEYLINGGKNVYLVPATISNYCNGPKSKILELEGFPQFSLALVWKRSVKQPEHIRRYLSYVREPMGEHFIEASKKRKMESFR